MARKFTRAQMIHATRDRLGLLDDGPAPMEKVSERPANCEVVETKPGEFHLQETTPARPQITKLGESKGPP